MNTLPWNALGIWERFALEQPEKREIIVLLFGPGRLSIDELILRRREHDSVEG